MSFEALARIRGVDAPGASGLLLLFILAEYAGADGCCFPSQATLSERSKLSVRAVRDNLHALEDAGLIAQERRNRKNGERTSNRIRLLYYVPEQAAETAGYLGETSTGRSASGRNQPAADFAATLGDDQSDQRQETTGQPAAGADLTSLEPVREPITLPDEREQDGFDEFWRVYPCKAEQRASRAIFGRIVKTSEATADELVAGAWRYAAEVLGREPRFVKNATTWLQRQGWLDRGATSPTAGAADQPQGFSRNRFAGPPELRAAIVAERGEAWTVSWIDPCGWDDDAKTVVPRTAFAGDRLRQDLGRQLRSWSVAIASPSQARRTA